MRIYIYAYIYTYKILFPKGFCLDMSLLSFSWLLVVTKVWDSLWRKVLPSCAGNWWLTVAMRLGIVWFHKDLSWGRLSLCFCGLAIPWHSQGELPPGSCVQLPSSGLCLSHQDSDWCARWLWQTTGASHFSTSLPRPQPRPASMTAFLLYLPTCFCAHDPYYWGVIGSWPVCSREGQTDYIG